MFVTQYIKAKRKVAWVHNDIRKLGYNHDLAVKVFKDFDAIVTVSKDNKSLVDEIVPDYKDKSFIVYNTHNFQQIVQKSKEGISPYEDNGKLHFVTVARLSMSQKRQDRIIEACGRLKKEGFSNFDWYLVGGGEREFFEKMAYDNDVTDIVKFAGLIPNPYPYVLHADAFVLTSIHEGLPMTVVEAKTLCCPVLLTAFGSAQEALKDGSEGCICANSSEGVYQMIKRIVSNPIELTNYRQYLREHPINNDIALGQLRDVCGL